MDVETCHSDLGVRASRSSRLHLSARSATSNGQTTDRSTMCTWPFWRTTARSPCCRSIPDDEASIKCKVNNGFPARLEAHMALSEFMTCKQIGPSDVEQTAARTCASTTNSPDRTPSRAEQPSALQMPRARPGCRALAERGDQRCVGSEQLGGMQAHRNWEIIRSDPGAADVAPPRHRVTESMGSGCGRRC